MLPCAKDDIHSAIMAIVVAVFIIFAFEVDKLKVNGFITLHFPSRGG